MTASTETPGWAMRLLMTDDRRGEPYCVACGERAEEGHDADCEVGKVIPLVDELVQAAHYALVHGNDPTGARLLAEALAPFEGMAR